MIYFHLFIGLSKSVSVRILNEILISKNKSVSTKHLNSLYSYENLVNNRLQLLQRNNWIFYKDGYYVCTKKAKLLVRINLFFLKLFKIDNSG